MDKKSVKDFFDSLAPGWDEELINKDGIIRIILDNSGINKGSDVLDVACGTGVMIPYYLERQVKSVTGIDISEKMAEIAEKKFPDENVSIICADAEEYCFDKKFDCIVVYNAFPHFPDPARLIGRLSSLLNPGGHLTVAHSMSREQIDAHHSDRACAVSVGLISEDDLADIFSETLEVTVKISDSRMYQVTGVKRQ